MSSEKSKRAIDPTLSPGRRGTVYPEPFKAEVADREKWKLGDLYGLTQFGVNLVDLAPGAWSAQRHWHTREDELIYVLEGELHLVTDSGAQALTAGMVAGFPAGQADGHHLVNWSGKPARYLEIGARYQDDEAHYPDIDLFLEKRGGEFRFRHKNGDPY